MVIPSPAKLTMEALKREAGVSDIQLDTKITQHDFYELAGYFENVENYIDKLGLTPGQQTEVRDLSKLRGIQTAMTEALKLWCRPNPYAATFRALLEILLDLRRGDVADKVCCYIKKEIPKHK